MEPVPTVDVALSPSASALPIPDPELMASAQTRSRIAIVLEGAYIVWLVALLAGGALGVALPSEDVITVLDVGLAIVALVGFLVWKWAAYKAAMQMSPEPLETTPGWAVGSYFIPFANLWLPYARMREIQQTAEADTIGLDGEASRGLIVLWWIVWIVAPILTRITDAADPTYETPLWLIAIGLVVASSALTILVVYRMNEEQQAQAASREAPEPDAWLG